MTRFVVVLCLSSFFPSRPHRQSGHETTTKNFKFMIRILFIVQQRKCDSTLDSSMLFLLFLCSFSARHTCHEVFRLVLVSHFDVVVSACVSLFILHFTSRGRRRGTQKIICFHWKIFIHVLLMKREGALEILYFQTEFLTTANVIFPEPARCFNPKNCAVRTDDATTKNATLVTITTICNFIHQRLIGILQHISSSRITKWGRNRDDRQRRRRRRVKEKSCENGSSGGFFWLWRSRWCCSTAALCCMAISMKETISVFCYCETSKNMSDERALHSYFRRHRIALCGAVFDERERKKRVFYCFQHFRWRRSEHAVEFHEPCMISSSRDS